MTTNSQVCQSGNPDQETQKHLTSHHKGQACQAGIPKINASRRWRNTVENPVVSYLTLSNRVGNQSKAHNLPPSQVPLGRHFSSLQCTHMVGPKELILHVNCFPRLAIAVLHKRGPAGYPSPISPNTCWMDRFAHKLKGFLACTQSASVNTSVLDLCIILYTGKRDCCLLCLVNFCQLTKKWPLDNLYDLHGTQEMGVCCL